MHTRKKQEMEHEIIFHKRTKENTFFGFNINKRRKVFHYDGGFLIFLCRFILEFSLSTVVHLEKFIVFFFKINFVSFCYSCHQYINLYSFPIDSICLIYHLLWILISLSTYFFCAVNKQPFESRKFLFFKSDYQAQDVFFNEYLLIIA